MGTPTTHARFHRLLLIPALGVVFVVCALVAVACMWLACGRRETAPGEGFGRWPKVAALVVPVLAASLVGAAYAYDASNAEVIAPGVRVGAVRVGGLTGAAARIKLERAYRRLFRPIVVRSGTRRFVLHPQRAGLVVHVDHAVSRALARSRAGWFVSRTLRELLGHGVDADVTPPITFSMTAVHRFAHRVEKALEHTPRPARVIPSGARLVLKHERDGLEVKSRRLHREIERVLTAIHAPRSLVVPARRIRPRVTTAALRRRYPSYITVDRARFQLRLYAHLKLVRTYPIAVGQIGFDTPAGVYHIQNKAVDPSWSVPHSSWTGALAGAVIPPGPANPLKARWLGIYGGAGIHGTDETWSLGSAASHGCIRMAIPDVIELYDRVKVGTPIYIG